MKPPSVDYSQFGNYSDSARQAIESGASMQDVQNAYQNVQQSQPAQQGNWFTRLLPAAGGVLGGLAGTLIPGLDVTGVSEIAGSGIGQGIGKGLENVLTGNPWSQGVGSNALQGAAFGGVGKLAGAGLKGLSGAATGTGEAIAKSTSDAEQATKTAQQAYETAQQQASQKAAQATTEKQAQADLKAAADQKIAASLANYKGVISDQANNFAKHQADLEKIGVDSSSPTAVNNYANTVLSHAGGKLNEVLSAQPGADMTNWLDNATKQYGLESSLAGGTSKFGAINPDILAASGGSSGEASLVGSNSFLEDAVNGFLKSHPQYKTGDLNTGTMPLSDLKDLKSEIGNQQSLAKGSINTANGINTIAKGNYNNLSKLYNDLTNKLSTPEVNKAIEQSTFTPEQQAAVRTSLKDTPQTAEELINGWNNAKTYQEVNQLLKPATQMKNVSNEALNRLKKAEGQGVKERVNLGANPQQGIFEAPSTPPTQVPVKPVAPEPVEPPPAPVAAQQTKADGSTQLLSALHPALGAAVGAAKLAKQLGTNPAVLKRTGSILDKISKIAPSAVVGTGGLISAGAQPAGGSMQNQSMQQGMQNQGQNQLASLLSTLTAQEQASPINFASSLGPVISALAPIVQRQNVGAGVAQNLAGAYQNAGGAQGPISGAITNLSSFIPGTPANAYQRQQQATASTLAQLLGISPQQAMQMLPQITQSAGTAAPMMNNVQGLLSSYGG